MPDNRSDPRPEPRSKRWFVALNVVAAILLALGVAVTLTVAGRRVPQASEPVGEPLTPQEVAEIKAAVEKQTGMPVRHVWRNRDGVVEVFIYFRRPPAASLG
jgi:hypothetical protein